MAPENINPSSTRQVFVSNDSNHRVVRVMQREVPSPTAGEAVEVWPSLVYEFSDGYLVIDDRRRELDAAFFEEHAEVLKLKRGEDGEWKDDPQRKWLPSLPAEEWLRQSSGFDNAAWGYTEIDHLVPDTGPVLELVTDALTARDTEKLLELYREEEDGHKRPAILDRITAAIEKLDAEAEAREQELEAAREAGVEEERAAEHGVAAT